MRPFGIKGLDKARRQTPRRESLPQPISPRWHWRGWGPILSPRWVGRQTTAEDLRRAAQGCQTEDLSKCLPFDELIQSQVAMAHQQGWIYSQPDQCRHALWEMRLVARTPQLWLCCLLAANIPWQGLQPRYHCQWKAELILTAGASAMCWTQMVLREVPAGPCRIVLGSNAG